MIVHLEDCADRTAEGYPLVMRRMVDRDMAPGLSITWVRIWGDHPAMRTDEADRAYYIIDGTGWFEVGDDPVAPVGAGDVVLIARGTGYAFGGEMTYLVMNGPAFRDGSDIVLTSAKGR
jgi:mannose-6-phosphate isomerase-like protein (cupin superfamily)